MGSVTLAQGVSKRTLVNAVFPMESLLELVNDKNQLHAEQRLVSPVSDVEKEISQ